ncbi:MAG: DUF2007 domain-containing protein [Bacteroidetes bacterium]|nr:MAG: DUF2007 domain-containing protein [Bacteroidota bacterium]
MEKGWTNIRNFNKAYLAEIAKEVLTDNNIESVIINKKDSSYTTFGDIELYVREENAETAKQLIKEL